MGTKPTHEQAQLHLQVYDLRRETRLRQARDWFQQNYRADTMEEATKLAQDCPLVASKDGVVCVYEALPM